MVNIVIIGGGRGGTALIDLLKGDPGVKILGVADVKASSAGITIAKRLKIPTTSNFRKLLTLPDLHFVIDVTQNDKVRKELDKVRYPNLEIISGTTAKFMWEQVEDRVRQKEMIEQLLLQYQSIYDLGLKLTACQSLSGLLFSTVEEATKLTNTPAGSVAIFNERRGKMSLGAVKGFSEKFSKRMEWTLRKGGLTHSILNSKEPLVIEDIRQYRGFDSPIMLNEGIRSLMASPLVLEGKIVGILYVNDFIVRRFNAREISLFWLMSKIATNTIEKLQEQKITMEMAITDGLTGLYNHRYFVKRLAEETKRAKRHGSKMVLAIVDIDDFKRYNDSHGHLKGNKLLQKVGSMMKKHFREVDVLARIGGDEFAIIFPDTAPKEAMRAVDRFRKKVAEKLKRGKQKNSIRSATFSAGIAWFPWNGRSPHQLIEQTDRVLYEAKRSGKNRTILAPFNDKKERKKSVSR